MTGSPHTCSGLAYSGVSIRSKPIVCSGVAESESEAEQLGDTKVEKLRHAIVGYQDVARLQVAMNDEVLMSELDGGAHGAKQLQPLVDGESMGVAVLVNGHAIDELHDQVGISFFGAATVQQSSDVGMFEAGQDLAFGLESRYRESGKQIHLSPA